MWLVPLTSTSVGGSVPPDHETVATAKWELPSYVTAYGVTLTVTVAWVIWSWIVPVWLL